ncbi:MAG: Hsp20/alpha crystallin family protein [Halobacteriales archaeon]
MIDTDELLRRLEEEGAEIMRVLGERMPVFADVLESDDEVLVLIDLPGCEKHSVDLQFEEGVGFTDGVGGRLRVEARREKPLEEGFRYVAEARSDFVRGSVPVHADVNYDESEATYENGLLRVRLPKTAGTEIDLE